MERLLQHFDDLDDFDAEVFGELVIAIVVGRHGQDSAGAIAHHDVVRDPDGDLLLVDGVNGVAAGEDTGLLLGEFGTLEIGLGGAGLFVFLNLHFLAGSGDLVDERMLGCEHHVGGTKERVGTRGENGPLLSYEGEVDFSAVGETEPGKVR